MLNSQKEKKERLVPVACTERKKVEHSKVRVDLSTSTFIFSTRLKVDLSSTFFRLSSTFIFFDRLFFVSTFIDFNRLFHQKSKSRSKIFIFCNPGVLVTGAKCSAVKSQSNSNSCTCSVSVALALQIQLADFFSSFFNVIFHLELEFSILEISTRIFKIQLPRCRS